MTVPVAKFFETLKTIAPLELAAEWDNVGLMVEGTQSNPIDSILLCIDLTHAVIDEAIAQGVNAIVSYHPPIFGGIKRLTRRSPSQNLLIRLIEAKITVWSPHTALDAAENGLGDWLLDCFGELKERSTITSCPSAPENPAIGMGRQGRLSTPRPIEQLADEIKSYLSLSHIRIAKAQRHKEGASIKRVAVCPGAGGTLFSSVRHVDLLLTGEMRHHDILSKVSNGTSVILTDHTNTERGYLPILQERLRSHLGVTVHVSNEDADPLTIF